MNIHVHESMDRLSTQASNQPDALQAILQETFSAFARRTQASQTQVEIVSEAISGPAARTFSNWPGDDPGLARIIAFAQEKSTGTLCVQKTFPEWDDTIYGSIHFEDPLTLVLHLASVKKQPLALKRYMEALILRWRGNESRKFKWREEYFRKPAQKPYPIGKSWDLFPYPNSARGFPGITAWLTNDGKAEIIVRLLK